jgi:DinB family protein
MHANPYAADLGSRDPLEALGETPGLIGTLLERWADDRFDRSYAPGKWTARQILIHLAQTELALTVRARFAVSTPGYVAQAFSQDDWVPLDDGANARTALDAYLALRRFNLEMWRRLSPEQRNRRFQHPEYGELTAGWIMAQIAGHDIHHLKQLEKIV